MSGEKTRVLLIAAFFAASRFGYFLLGVRFDASPLGNFMQYPDPLLLRNDLIRTSYYFHMTPPLYNILLGVDLKLFGRQYAAALNAAYLAGGLLLAVSLYLLMRALKANPAVSLAVAAMFVASPATVMYENWLYPDYLIAAVLTFAAWLIWYAVTNRHLLALVGFSAILGAIVLGRNYFHLAWLLVCVGILILLAPRLRREVLLAAAIPILLGAGLYVKNYEVLGFFGATSASGINAYTLSTLQLTPAERQQLRQQGKISALVADTNNWFKARPGIFDPRTGIPVLDSVSKSTGAPNWGNRGWMVVWEQYSKDAVATIKAKPVVLLRALRMSLLILFLPSDQHDFSLRNHAAVHGIARAADVVLYGQPRSVFRSSQDPASYTEHHLPERLREVGWLIAVGYLLALGFGIWIIVRGFRAGLRGDLVMPVFTVLTAVYILVIDVLFGIPDNNRYRFMADPLVTALLGAALSAMIGRLRGVTFPYRRAVGASAPAS